MSSRDLGLIVITGGVTLVVVGLLIWSGGLAWFGRLPGDIRYERGNTRVYVPITSMLLISVVLSVILAIVRKVL
jgi:uncharacterized membrane protein YidH (DUF202 family)